jgi:hypothetical protein
MSFRHRCLHMQGCPKMKYKLFPCEIEAFTMRTLGGDVEVVQVKADEGFTPLSVV